MKLPFINPSRPFFSAMKPDHYGWFGDYASWEEARADCTGYNDRTILIKVKDALMKVKNGQAAFERDSVLFDHIEYAWPLLAGLMWIAAINQGELNVLDFGGSLGSTYFQNRQFLQKLTHLSWSIVEQPQFVQEGKKHFADASLHFYHTIDACLATQKPQVLLLLSVLQYLEDPYDFLRQLTDRAFPYIILDRTAFSTEDRDRLTVQKVSPTIYKASYPAWFLNQSRFLKVMQPRYTLAAEFNCPDQANIPSTFRGFIFCRKNVRDRS